MDWFSYAKLFHIAFAAVWTGAGVCLLILAFAAVRSKNDADTVRVVQNCVYLTPRLFIPMSLLTLLTGVVATWLSYGFRELWIVLGLAGFAITFLIGIFVLKPSSEKLSEMFLRNGDMATVAAESRSFLRHFAFDYVILFLILTLMVLKPTTSDRGLLAAMFFVLLATAIILFRPKRANQA